MSWLPSSFTLAFIRTDSIACVAHALVITWKWKEPEEMMLKRKHRLSKRNK